MTPKRNDLQVRSSESKSNDSRSSHVSDAKHPSETEASRKNPLPVPNAGERKVGPTTRITIQFDVGFSNALFIRGKGASLSWDKGIQLKNVKSNEWVWETAAPFTTCEFKVLINDKDYEIGDNHLLTCGASVHYTPKFN